MLLGELSDLFKIVLDDFARFDIEQIIRDAVTVLSWKGTAEAGAYPGEAYRLKAEAEFIIEQQHPLLSTERAGRVFGNSLFANLLPGDIARQLASFLTVDIALSAPTTEAQFLLLRFQSARTLIEGFVQVAAGLGLRAVALPEDRAALSLHLPGPLFADPARLGETLGVVDAFFRAVAEQSGGAAGPAQLHGAADAALTLHLSVEPRLALPLMATAQACRKAARSARDFERALEEMRRAEVPADLLDQAITAHETTRAAHLARALEEIFARADPRPASAAPRDVTRLTGLCLRIARYMAQGLVIGLVRPLAEQADSALPDIPLPAEAEGPDAEAEAEREERRPAAIRTGV